MKIAIVDTYYPAFLSAIYADHPQLEQQSYEQQRSTLLNQCFGTSDFYSRNLNNLGFEAHDLIVNCLALQRAWALNRGAFYDKLFFTFPPSLLELPFIGRRLAKFQGLEKIACAQIEAFAPDILYCQDLSFFSPTALKKLRNHVRLIVGQIASPLPPERFLKGYDLILTSFPHYVSRLRMMGVASEYFRIGFDNRVLEKLGNISKDLDFSFIGGISRNHKKSLSVLEYLAHKTPIQFFGYGYNDLDSDSPIRTRHHGEVWGMRMYKTLARSRLTLNRHIDVAENYANNMRLFEATGVGTMLITDQKSNLYELFEIGKEMVTYSSKEEASEIVKYYLNNPEEAENIAKAGQARTLREHTYAQRMVELTLILRRYI